MNERVRLGGLMRCCTETLSERATPGTDGEIQPCKYCTQSTIFRDGAWEWNRPSQSLPATNTADRAARGFL